MSFSKKLTCKGTLRQVFYLSRLPTLLWPRTPPYTLYTCILLGLPVFAKRSQTWTGLLNAERVNRKSKVYSRVEQFTRPTECPIQPRRMIDAIRVFTFILQRQLGATLRLSFEQRTGLGLTDFLEALRTVRRNKARHNDDEILISKARYCSLLSRCWNGKNPWVSINLCFGSVLNYDQSYIWLCNLLLLKSGSERPGDFYKSVAIKCHVQ
jgi:hypothetical protein